jgi:hypothetical protein
LKIAETKYFERTRFYYSRYQEIGLKIDKILEYKKREGRINYWTAGKYWTGNAECWARGQQQNVG